MCSPALIDRINDFAKRHRAAGVPAVFFRGQLLELMRWTARHAKHLRNDGETYVSPECRERCVKAALIAGGPVGPAGLWRQADGGDTGR
jgi:hypothetical protein